MKYGPTLFNTSLLAFSLVLVSACGDDTSEDSTDAGTTADDDGDDDASDDDGDDDDGDDDASDDDGDDDASDDDGDDDASDDDGDDDASDDDGDDDDGDDDASDDDGDDDASDDDASDDDDDPESASGLGLVRLYAGTYAVQATQGEHARGNVRISDDGSVFNFDRGLRFQLSGDDVYNRIPNFPEEPRVQIEIPGEPQQRLRIFVDPEDPSRAVRFTYDEDASDEDVTVDVTVVDENADDDDEMGDDAGVDAGVGPDAGNACMALEPMEDCGLTVDIAGTYTDDWGSPWEISNCAVNGNAITAVDNDAGWIVYQNSCADAWNPELWSRIDFTPGSVDGGMVLFICTQVYNGATEQDAKDAPRAVSEDPANGGCGAPANDFSWSVLTAN